MLFNVGDYKPSYLTAVLVFLSAAAFILILGIYGAVLYLSVLRALTGIHPNEPLQLSFGVWFVAIPMLVSMLLGMVLGGVAWIILVNITLPSNAARYWATYPTPHIPILTPFFGKLNDWILNIRSRKQKRS